MDDLCCLAQWIMERTGRLKIEGRRRLEKAEITIDAWSCASAATSSALGAIRGEETRVPGQRVSSCVDAFALLPALIFLLLP